MLQKHESASLAIKEASHNVLTSKSALFLATYTGIEESQLTEMTDPQREKVFLGLFKQLDLATSLHGPQAKQELRGAIGNYFSSESSDIHTLTPQINSLLIYGDIRDLKDSGVEYLHDRLAHFWRILGWEELKQVGACDTDIKYPAGSIEPVLNSCGNLIRTLDLLSERWDETGQGPHLIFPIQNQRISKEEAKGYRASRLRTDYTNTLAVITGRNEGIPSEESKDDFKEKGMLLDRLLARYPMEFAYLIFDYYAFAQDWSDKAYNVAVTQEYVENGERKVKGIINGKTVALLGKSITHERTEHTIIATSNNDTITGSPVSFNPTYFDLPVEERDQIVLIHGETASVVMSYPDVIHTFDTRPDAVRNKVSQFAGAIGQAKKGKPMLVSSFGKVNEYHPVKIDEETIGRTIQEVKGYLNKKSITAVNIEAGHIHADTTASRRQLKGMEIGAKVAAGMEQNGISVVRSTMIDEDHVPNVLDHKAYLNLMKQQGYELDEVVYESSPVIREIAVSTISTLVRKYPENFQREGNALMFKIPDTDLYVEMVKDTTVEPFELGCVIFDTGLTLYKVYPELATLYTNRTGNEIHQEMLDIYVKTRDIKERTRSVKETFPYRSATAQHIEQIAGLPEFSGEKRAILNILEGFYTPQQQKLEGMLKALGVPISLIDITFSNQGLQLHLPDGTLQ